MKNEFKIKRNVSGKMRRTQGLAQHLPLKVCHLTKEPVQSEDEIKTVASPSVWPQNGCLKLEQEEGTEGQRTETNEQGFPDLKITSMSRLRSLALLRTFGTNEKQIEMNDLNSSRALRC